MEREDQVGVKAARGLANPSESNSGASNLYNPFIPSEILVLKTILPLMSYSVSAWLL
jgi:hypothetical protein